MDVISRSRHIAVGLLILLLPPRSLSAIPVESLHFNTANVLPPQRCKVDESMGLEFDQNPARVGRISNPSGYRLETIENVVSALPIEDALLLLQRNLRERGAMTKQEAWVKVANEIYDASHDQETNELLNLSAAESERLLVAGINMLQLPVAQRLEGNGYWGASGLAFVRSTTANPARYGSWSVCETSNLPGASWSCGTDNSSFRFSPETGRFSASYLQRWRLKKSDSAQVFLGTCTPYYD